MKKLIIILFVVGLFILNGCAEKEKPLCKGVYYEYKTGECCIDKDSNQICDMDQIYDTYENEETESKEEPLDTCGNDVCEDYELLANCKKDCEGLETHNYGFCREVGWGGVDRVKVLGTETYLDKGEVIGPDMKPRPTCGKENDPYGTNDCFYCYYVDEVHEPIFEIQVTGSTDFSVCENLVKKYFIDGVDQGCHGGKWEYVGDNAYYPYDKKRYDLFKRVEVHDWT